MDFNKTYKTEAMKKALLEAFDSGYWHGRGPYTEKVESLLAERYGRKVWMTTSCTHALELAVRLCQLGPGDEVIMPSYACSSDGNAVLLCGASICYAPVEKNHYCLDLEQLAQLISSKTKAILVVHYAGVSCKIKELAKFCQERGLLLIEDAAQAFGSTVDGQPLGSFGDYGVLSFHSTKNVACGEGGALIVADQHQEQRDEIECFLEKGTDREASIRGDQESYQWSGLGSSFVPSDMLMAILYEGLKTFAQDNDTRRIAHYRYTDFFKKLNHPAILNYSGKVEEETKHNAHLFYLVFQNKKHTQQFIEGMKQNQIDCYRHFHPLHASLYGRQFTAKEASFSLEEHLGESLVRLPLYTRMTREETGVVLRAVAKVMGNIHG